MSTLKCPAQGYRTKCPRYCDNAGVELVSGVKINRTFSPGLRLTLNALTIITRTFATTELLAIVIIWKQQQDVINKSTTTNKQQTVQSYFIAATGFSL